MYECVCVSEHVSKIRMYAYTHVNTYIFISLYIIFYLYSCARVYVRARASTRGYSCKCDCMGVVRLCLCA